MSAVATARFTVEAIPEAVAAYVREHGRDPIWGHPTLTQPATGFGPCRLCLRTFDEGEPRTLFTYDSYARVARFPQPGPVYVHAGGCSRYDEESFPPDLRELKLTFEAVAPGPRVVALERTEGGEVEGAIERLLDLAEVEYVNVRNTEAGCFVARVEPVRQGR
jgi:Protein of unknown function (DUF1203)